MKTSSGRYLLFLIFLIPGLIFSSCNKEIAGPDENAVPVPIPYPYNSAHFRFYYTSYDSLSIKAISDSVEGKYSEFLSDLQTDFNVKVNVHFYKTHEELEEAAGFSLPLWTVGLPTAKDQIHMISPKHPDQDYSYMIVALIHEFAHCVTLNINASFGNRPRWLWESIASYEAGQFVHPSLLPYMVQHNPPTLDELNSVSNTRIYEVGYLLAEYIVLNWSSQHLRDLIVNNGNITQTLGTTTAEFEAGWFSFVRERYSI